MTNFLIILVSFLIFEKVLAFARGGKFGFEIKSKNGLTGHSLFKLQQHSINSCLYSSTSSSAVASSDKQKGTSSFLVSSTNLVKNCVGAGVFSLNSRVSSISCDPSCLSNVVVLVLAMALWAAYNFAIVGETCRLTESETFGEAWSKTVSKKSVWIIQTIVTIAPIIGCLANTIVLTDVFKLVSRSAGAPLWFYSNRNLVIATLISFILYPICTLKDLSALKSVSVVGIFGQFTAMGVLGYRLFDKSYLPTGKYFASSIIGAKTTNSIIQSTRAITQSQNVPTKWFVLASLLSYCYVTHYNAPRYYNELKGKENDSNLFFKMSLLSYISGAIIYFGTILLSFKLFGEKSASFALNSFSPNDPLAIMSLLAFGTSVLASFPLVFLVMRNWFISTAKSIPSLEKIANIKIMSGLLLTFIGLLASLFTDIGKVGSLSGAVFGSAMMFIFPPLMYIKALINDSNSNKKSLPKLKIGSNLVLLLCGVSLSLLGTYNTILSLIRK